MLMLIVKLWQMAHYHVAKSKGGVVSQAFKYN